MNAVSPVSPQTTVKLSAAGAGQCSLSPPSGTRWDLRLAAVSTTGTILLPQCFLYLGNSNGPLTLVDSTNSGNSASSGKVAGAPLYAGTVSVGCVDRCGRQQRGHVASCTAIRSPPTGPSRDEPYRGRVREPGRGRTSRPGSPSRSPRRACSSTTGPPPWGTLLLSSPCPPGSDAWGNSGRPGSRSTPPARTSPSSRSALTSARSSSTPTSRRTRE